MKYLGKKNRIILFQKQLQILKRFIKVTDVSKSAVFSSEDMIHKKTCIDTLDGAKESFRIWCQEDIMDCKTILYHLDPTEDKLMYHQNVAPIADWATFEEKLKY